MKPWIAFCLTALICVHSLSAQHFSGNENVKSEPHLSFTLVKRGAGGIGGIGGIGKNGGIGGAGGKGGQGSNGGIGGNGGQGGFGGRLEDDDDNDDDDDISHGGISSRNRNPVAGLPGISKSGGTGDIGHSLNGPLNRNPSTNTFSHPGSINGGVGGSGEKGERRNNNEAGQKGGDNSWNRNPGTSSSGINGSPGLPGMAVNGGIGGHGGRGGTGYNGGTGGKGGDGGDAFGNGPQNRDSSTNIHTESYGNRGTASPQTRSNSASDFQLLVNGVPMVNRENCLDIYQNIALAIGYNWDLIPRAEVFRLERETVDDNSDPPLLLKFANIYDKLEFSRYFSRINNLNLMDIGFRSHGHIYISSYNTEQQKKNLPSASKIKNK